jgi:hypothetical protein
MKYEIIKNLICEFVESKTFSLCQRLGFNVVPLHYYNPIPNLNMLDDDTWFNPTKLAGVDMREEDQVNLLSEFGSKFKIEYDTLPLRKPNIPYKYYLSNGVFQFVDACILYCMIRHFKPNKIFEIGSGWSTCLSAEALLRNEEETGHLSELVAFEPYPNDVLKAGFPGLSKLLPSKAENINLAKFEELGENDILFIDSSHVLKIGGDVKFLYLEVLPRIKRKVLVHCHDIFLPADYPQSWVLKDHRFWTEQYLLQAFLAFNTSFEVLWAGNYMRLKHPELLKKAFSTFDLTDVLVGSFWMRRK